ncbi:hypothetical protein AAG906_018508 [Vitis piasezkii]
MLLTARQRRSITASMPVLGAQWWWCDVRYQCKPNSCSSSPGACYVQTPLASQCNAASGPTTSATSPGSSPADSSDDTPDVPTTPSESGIPSGAGSKTVPLTDGSSSDGGIMDSPLHFVVLLFITSCVSTFTGF